MAAMQNQLPHLLTAAQGFGLGLSLIVAIGAQNAFVLRQGLRREWVGSVVLVCALTYVALIALGVAGAVWSAAARPAPTYVAPTVTYYPPQPAPSASYYCASSGQYYPYTSYCPEGWQLVQPAYR